MLNRFSRLQLWLRTFGSAEEELIYWQSCCSALFAEQPSLPVRPDPAQEFATKSALRPGSSVVERGPEKAGVGGSIPSLATT